MLLQKLEHWLFKTATASHFLLLIKSLRFHKSPFIVLIFETITLNPFLKRFQDFKVIYHLNDKRWFYFFVFLSGLTPVASAISLKKSFSFHCASSAVNSLLIPLMRSV